MKKSEYKAYLQSAEWREKRNEAFEYHGSFCNRCDLPRWLAELVYDQDLHVHHISYATRGDEDLDDLEILCARCHEIETFGRSELRKPKESTCEECECIHWDYRSPYCSSCQEMRSDFYSVLKRLDKSNPADNNLPYRYMVFRKIVVDMVWEGTSPADIASSLAKTAEVLATKEKLSLTQDIPF